MPLDVSSISLHVTRCKIIKQHFRRPSTGSHGLRFGCACVWGQAQLVWNEVGGEVLLIGAHVRE